MVLNYIFFVWNIKEVFLVAKVAEGIGKNYDEAVKDALNKVGLTKEQVSIEMIE